MECLYINLDAQKDRRDYLEANFAACKKHGWNLRRIPATDVAFVETNEIIGLLTAREKACYISHVHAIEEALKIDGPVMILEDDAAFGPRSCAVIDEAVETLPQGDWDILYSDLGLGSVHKMVDYALLRRQVAADGEIRILSLEDTVYFGATAYILNGKAKKAYYEAVTENKALNVPYDLFPRRLIGEKKMRGFVIFPFATTTSRFSTSSQVQPGATLATDYILDAYRKIIWNDRDISSCLGPLEDYARRTADPETRAYAAILGAMLAEEFKRK
jgi:GR25 family glycosyltransferase involved in LPS biosynthesis